MTRLRIAAEYIDPAALIDVRFNSRSLQVLLYGLPSILYAIYFGRWLGSLRYGADTAMQPGAAAWPVLLVAEIVVGSLVIVGVYRYWSRLPDKVQDFIRMFSVLAFVQGLGYLWGLVGWWQGLAGTAAIGAALHALDVGRVWHVGHTVAAFGLTVMAAGYIGYLLDPLHVVIVLIALLMWDMLAVDHTDIMADLTTVSASLSVPNYFLIYNPVGSDYSKPESVIDRESLPDGFQGIIGAGDYILPGSLVVAAALTHSIVVGGVVLTGFGTGLLAATAVSRERPIPALPTISWYTLLAYAFAVVIL